MMHMPVGLRSCPVRRGATRHPDRPAIVQEEGVTVTYGELDDQVRRCAAGLRARGVEPGMRLAVDAAASPRLITLLFACFREGVVATLPSTRLPASAFAEHCRAADVDALAADEGSNRSPAGEAFAMAELLLAAPKRRGVTSRWTADSPATIVFTSGSTGVAKPVLLSLGNHVYSALGSSENIPVGPGDRWLLSLPLYHVGGLSILFRCFLAGASVALPAAGSPLSLTMQALRPTHVSMVATQLRRLLDDAGTGRMKSVKAILLGGSAIPGALIDESLRGSLPVHTSYGMTEMASQVATTPPGSDRRTLATSGFVLPHREVRIDGDDTIHVRGRTRFLGYVNGRDLELPFTADGWFRTGDTGRFDEMGRLIVTGRIDDMFISGGENVQPRAIERALCSLDGIRDAVVVPVADEEFGFRPVAFIDSDGRPQPDVIMRLLRDVLPGFMVPRTYLPMPAAAPERLKRSRAELLEIARGLQGSGQGCTECDTPETTG